MKDGHFLVEAGRAFINTSPLNRVEALGGMVIYEEPVFGFASADDPLFEKLKEPEVVGPAHRLPEDFLPGAKTLVSYFLPFSEQVRTANRIEGLPAIEWLYGRIEGEACNDGLRRFLVQTIEGEGGRAAAPVLEGCFAVRDRRSNWSERHAAFISGLGTFGMSKSFITAKGSAGRLGSVITDLELPVTERLYQEVYEYCTWCGDCQSRCPSGAITAEGKKVAVCADYLDAFIKPKFAPRYGCGKCQTGVQCEFSRPAPGATS